MIAAGLTIGINVSGPAPSYTLVGSTKLNLPEQGFDSGTFTALMYAPDGPEYAVEALFERGSHWLGKPWMYVADVDLAQEGSLLWMATVTGRGLMHPSGGKGYKRKVTNNTESITSENLVAPGMSVSPAPGEVWEPHIEVVDTYVTRTKPLTVKSGTALTPPDPPDTPPFIWDTLENPVYNYPNGWVLNNRSFDEVVGAQIWEVTDTYIYRYTYKPG